MSFPGFAHLFEVYDPIAERRYRGEFRAHEKGAALSRAESQEDSSAVRVQWAMGSAQPGDVIWTTSAHPLIVHERLIELFRENHLTGWSTYAVEVYAKSGERVDGYHGLAITGRCGPVDLQASSIELVEYPGGWYPHFRGHFFVPDTWDGSDWFMHQPDAEDNASMVRMISERAHAVLLEARLANLGTRRLTEVSVGANVYSIGLQHMLPSDFRQRVDDAYRNSGVSRPASV